MRRLCNRFSKNRICISVQSYAKRLQKVGIQPSIYIIFSFSGERTDGVEGPENMRIATIIWLTLPLVPVWQ